MVSGISHCMVIDIKYAFQINEKTYIYISHHIAIKSPLSHVKSTLLSHEKNANGTWFMDVYGHPPYFMGILN